MESAALASKTLYIGCWIIGLAEGAKIGPTRVVEKDNDEIRSLCLCGSQLAGCESNARGPQKISSAGIHTNVRIISGT